MHVGVKTSLFGHKINNIYAVLDGIADSGFQGVEFSQRPDHLGVPDAETLARLLFDRGLTLLSITNGTLQERLTFLQGVESEYTYVSHWDLEQCPELITPEIAPVLHPGLFCPIQNLDDVVQMLNQWDCVGLILDTSHMHMVGENVADCLDRCPGNVVAVHLKDWLPEFGRSGPRYSRGFTLLGEGSVDLDGAIKTLQEFSFQGWLVAEVDQPRVDTITAFDHTAQWLIEKKLIWNQYQEPDTKLLENISGHTRGSFAPESEVEFLSRISLAGTRDLADFYAELAECFNDIIPSHLVSVWACSPSQSHLALMARSGKLRNVSDSGLLFQAKEMLSGIAIARQAAYSTFDLREKYPGKQYGYDHRAFRQEKLLEDWPIGQMVSIPITSYGKRNYTRIVVNVCPLKAITIEEEQILRMTEAVAIAADNVLDRLCAAAITRVNLLASQTNNKREFLQGLLGLIRDVISCEATAIFLENQTGSRLALEETTGTVWSPGYSQYYAKGDGSTTSRVWEVGLPKSKAGDLMQDHFSKSEERVSGTGKACIWMPINSSGNETIGVIRCRNKLIGPNMFLDEDAAILAAMTEAIAPHLKVLMDKERRTTSLQRLNHEMGRPITGILSAADHLARTDGVDRLTNYDFVGDISSWANLLARLVCNSDILGYSPEELDLAVTKNYLMRDVIAPAVKHLEIEVRDRGFSPRRIEYGNFKEVPLIHIDKNQFQQVVFNLLNNSIKHAYNDPNAFRVEIDGAHNRDQYLIWFRDWGPGIPAEASERIFEEGFHRSTGQHTVAGQGFGLSIVKTIIEAHDGQIVLTKRQMPTEFTIYLPDYLKDRGPRRF